MHTKIRRYLIHLIVIKCTRVVHNTLELGFMNLCEGGFITCPSKLANFHEKKEFHVTIAAYPITDSLLQSSTESDAFKPRKYLTKTQDKLKEQTCNGEVYFHTKPRGKHNKYKYIYMKD